MGTNYIKRRLGIIGMRETQAFALVISCLTSRRPKDVAK